MILDRKVLLLIPIILCTILTAVLLRHNNLQNVYLTQDVNFTGKTVPINSPNGTCVPHHHIFYLKVPKTGSSTIANIFARMTMVYNLISFELDRPKPHPKDIHVTQNGKYEICKCCHKFDIQFKHAHCNHYKIFKYMHNDTKLIASIRHPFYLFRSKFYFNTKIQKMLSNSTIVDEKTGLFSAILNEHLLQDAMGNYEFANPRLKMYQNKVFQYFGGKVSRGINEKGYLQDFINHIKEDFSNIIINEHFDESMVLLKRSLCLDMKDILYISHKNASYKGKDKLPEENLELNKVIKGLFSLDYAIYNFFLVLHEKKVQIEGSSFQSEVEIFQNIKDQTTQFCLDILNQLNEINTGSLRQSLLKRQLIINKTDFSEEFSVTGDYCILMGYHIQCYRKAFRARHYPQGCVHDDYPVRVSDKKYCLSSKGEFLTANIPAGGAVTDCYDIFNVSRGTHNVHG